MALRTNGFALSALPQAPSIPGNIGKVDTKAILQAVQDNLRVGDEVAMGAQRNMVERNTLDTQNAQALATQKRLPFATAAGIAEDQAATVKAPFTADPSVLGSTNRALASTNENTIAQNDYLLAHPELRKQLLLAKYTPSGLREFAGLTSGMTPEQVEHARRIKLGVDPRASGAAIKYEKMIGVDGKEHFVALDPDNVGAQVVGSGERYGAAVGDPRAPVAAGAPAAVTPDGATTAAPNAAFEGINQADLAGQKAKAEAEAKAAVDLATVGQIAGAKTTGEQQAKLQVERQEKLPKARAALRSLEDGTVEFDQAIQAARDAVEDGGVGLRFATFQDVPGTAARKLKAALLPIGSKVGFGALADMRASSPTGGALGNVSDRENELLQSTVVALNPSSYQSKAEFLSALDKLVQVRQAALLRARDAYSTDFGLATGAAGNESVAPNTAGSTYSNAPAAPAGGKKTFASEAEAEAAAARGEVKPGEPITIGGVSGTWQ